jgi:hypothetical protein
MKTSELTGAALDWAVAKCEGHTVNLLEVKGQRFMRLHKYSNDWAQGGPIIEREKIEITPWGVNGDWQARDFYEPSPGVPCAVQYGPTPLIAAMRCYVASKLGDDIDIPEELL